MTLRNPQFFVRTLQPRRILLWAALLLTSLLIAWGTTKRTQLLALNTLVLCVGAAAISVPAGALLAWLVTRTRTPGGRGFVWIMTVWLFVPLYLQAAAWEAGFGQQGWFSLFWLRLGSTPLLAGWRGAIWVHGVATIPWTFFLIAAALRLSSGALEDAARLDATPLRVWWRVTLPHIGSALVAATLWVCVMVSGEMTVTDLYQVRTFAEELYVGFATDEPGGTGIAPAAISTAAGVAMVSWLAFATLLVCVRLWPWEALDLPASPAQRLVLGRWNGLACATLVAAVVVLALVPLANLIYHAGIEVLQDGSQRIRQWSAAKAVWLVVGSPWHFQDEWGWSLALSQLASLAAVVLAVPLAWIARREGPAALAVLVTVAISLALPGPVLGLGVIRFVQLLPGTTATVLYDRTLAAPWIALTIRAYGPVALILWYGLRTVTVTEMESAKVAGAAGWKRLWLVVVAQRWPLLAAAWLVGTVICLGDLAASILVIPPGVTTIAIRIFGLVHYGVQDRLAAACLGGILFFMVLVMMWRSLFFRARN